MNTNDQPNGKSDMKKGIVKRIIQVVVQTLLFAVILFVSAGTLEWEWAWIYFGTGLAILVVNTLVMSPELIAERGQPRENVKGWDKLITGLVLLPTLCSPIVIGLDRRSGWSPELTPGVHLAALVLVVLGHGMFTWSMVSNKFFSTAVRIQMDRDQTVATGGPYRYIRHPGYFGYIVAALALPLVLGSLWGLIPEVVTSCLLVVRTALEDKTLQEELDGYREYAQQVRYRLVPGIW